ncbi:MAG: ImmA/IrrE family metallo-endopeptidase [Rhodospirillaceae bacterium]|nr:ImmA/IrrE family metallo-endopeptidase [Rhodospirillaceae bacterium]
MDTIFPLDVRLLAQSQLDVTFDEPEQINLDASVPNHLVPIETAGFIDRERNRIVVAQKFQPEYRRFTGAHEIGHWLLHPNLTYHRDRPLKGMERFVHHRPAVEYEADAFASELLMPSKVLKRYFYVRFNQDIHLSQLSETIVFQLSAQSSTRISDFTSRSKRHLALRVATCEAFAGRHFESIAKRFGVSPTAAAIRLEELQLVRN